MAERSKVYFTRDVSPAGLMKVYEALAYTPRGKTAVKLSTGEPGGHNYLKPELVEHLIQKVDGTIVECNTAYKGKRMNVADSLKAADEHGFTSIAKVDIMDADGEMRLPIVGGRHLSEDVVGANFAHYDSCISLAHFKGHAMAGFGGALKNIAIGIASPTGKSLIHTAGKRRTGIGLNTPQDDFLESIAEAAKAIVDYKGDDMAYVNVMNNMSVDCDCDPHPAEPDMADIGILASRDPVAIDRACVNLVYKAPDGASLIERMEEHDAARVLIHAETLGVGSQSYELFELE